MGSVAHKKVDKNQRESKQNGTWQKAGGLRMFQCDLGSVLKAIRVGQSIKQGDLASAVTKSLEKQVDQTAISRIENNDREITGPELIAVCLHLGCDFGELIEVACQLHQIKSRRVTNG